MNFLKNLHPLYIIAILQSITYIVVLSCFNGTGDSGDSVMHYLYAKHSFEHPELFFNHWAKPIFVLLASTFAQFGIIGIKIFNASLMILCTVFTFKTIEKLGIENPAIGSIIIICAPLTFVLTFSGLTEPLFATMVIISLYLLVSEHLIAGCLVSSFLPFVRSEGLIILGMVAIYLFARKMTKRIPWLSVGTIIYMVLGGIIKNNFMWVFTEIPYANLDSPYNKLSPQDGRLFHFIVMMNYVVGVPIYILFWVGVLTFISNLRNLFSDFKKTILVFGAFTAYFAAHTLFWYLGIFNSMGLNRVLIGVMPLIAIISLVGYNRIIAFTGANPIFKKILSTTLLVLLLAFPFTSNPAAIRWKRDMNLSLDERLSIQIAACVHEHSFENRRMFFLHPYLSESLSIDWFDSAKRMNLNLDGMKLIQPGDIVIWDNWFSVVEGGVSEDFIRNSGLFNEICVFTESDRAEVKLCVFEYIGER